MKHSHWAAPIVPVLKKNGTVRICGDFKTTINQVSQVESYPLPRVEDLFANLAGGENFTKLDLSQAYLQLPLEEESKEYVTVNTHKGLFRYNRLPFGVSSAPAIFQRTIETLMQGLKGVATYLDDILITGATTEEHLYNLNLVLERLAAANLRVNREKCFFLQPRLVYLGHTIDKHGIHPTEDKIAAIKDAPTPKDVSQLRSFLGILNYYNKFLPNLSTTLKPLHSLLCKDARWSWQEEHEKAFQCAKNALQADSLLVHYDSSKPLVLACDASQYGLGAVLSHIMDDGQERPIAYVSRTLNPAEKKYSQLEKEGLAIVFGVTKFHNYLFGRHFQIESDHQPLASLFSESRAIPQMASSRIQRWALTLSAYQYSIRYKPGKTLNNADALSRLPRPSTTMEANCVPGDVEFVINHLSATAASAGNVKDWTAKDAVFSRVRQYLLLGWPDQQLGEEFKPFTSRKDELSLQDGCILWGSRVVIPPQGREAVLEELHESHPGICKMKALARSCVWWPKMDHDIEHLVKTCTACQETRAAPPGAPLHPWEWPAKPWSRLHLDFAGPYLDHMFLVIVDAHSKWLDVQIMQSITSSKTIEKLRTEFATHRIPQKVVTDNGPSFTSSEFRDFMSRNGIKHVTSAPYHPASNGLAERAVQSFKLGIKRITEGSLQDRLSKFLFTYRITPHSTTGVAPAELLMGRRLRSRLDLLYPDLQTCVETQQLKQKQQHDSTKPLRSFLPGDTVFAQNFRVSNSEPKWLPATVVVVTGPLSYQVELQDGSTVRRHIDNLKRRDTDQNSTTEQDSALVTRPLTPSAQASSVVADRSTSSGPSQPLPPLRRSARPHQVPGWFSEYERQ